MNKLANIRDFLKLANLWDIYRATNGNDFFLLAKISLYTIVSLNHLFCSFPQIPNVNRNRNHTINCINCPPKWLVFNRLFLFWHKCLWILIQNSIIFKIERNDVL